MRRFVPHTSVSRWLSGGIVVLTGTTIAGHFTLYGALLTALQEDMHVGSAQMGLLSTLLYAGIGLAYLPGGALSDRYGPGRVLSCSLLLVGLGSALFPLVSGTFPLVLLCRFLIGLGMGASITAASQQASRLGRSAALGQGLYGGAMQVGTALGLFAPAWLTQKGMGWETIFLLWGAGAFVLSLCWQGMTLLLSRPSLQLARQRRTTVALRTPALYRLGLIHAGTLGIGQALAPWLVASFLHVGAPETLAVILGSATLCAGIVFRPLGGLLHRRLGSRGLLFLGPWLTTLGLCLLALAGLLPPHPLMLSGQVFLLVLVSLGTTLPYAAVFAKAGEIGTQKKLGPGTAQGVVSTLSAPASACGPLLIGWLVPSGSFPLAFAVLSVLALLALYSVWRTQEPRSLTWSHFPEEPTRPLPIPAL